MPRKRAPIRNGNRRPTHPGELLREDVMPAAGLTQVSLAKHALSLADETLA